MKKIIHLNLKRFDILRKFGGVNDQGNPEEWGARIITQLEPFVNKIADEYETEFVCYFPEVHLIPAKKSATSHSKLAIGCQSIYKNDVSIGGNFGAFTTHRPASSMGQIGVVNTIIGHFEERLDKIELLKMAGVEDFTCVNSVLNQQIIQAQRQGLKILYCIGEFLEQKENWQSILRQQIEVGLADVALEQVSIAYEPLWAIGPGKIPPTADQIQEISEFIKSLLPNTPLLYGGGLKSDNAQEIAAISSLDGGLIALTRFDGKIGFYPEEYQEIVRKYLGIENEVLL